MENRMTDILSPPNTITTVVNNQIVIKSNLIKLDCILDLQKNKAFEILQ